MDKDELTKLLTSYKNNGTNLSDVISKLSLKTTHHLDFARPDINRKDRCGFGETIFCPGKSPRQIVEIAQVLLQNSKLVLASKATSEVFHEVKILNDQAKYIEQAKVIYFGEFPKTNPNSSNNFTCGLVTAGTSDLSVSEEACVFLQAMGINLVKFYDIGVADLSRVLNCIDDIRACQVVIVVCGMDAALGSVIGGLVACPVIAVPSSVGYGTNMAGVSALLSLLNSCANGITVVNIDNGYGAAIAAYRIYNKVYSQKIST